ncbi:hypothetical protein N7495_006459 [Penicillium taxi]|uniref:uncharacterized protein n=1 Tax=Penicillium taxi TaxID=168475 RepID=UPI0025454A68|nr:uncharacterized protein N7495_006459 [Penicillium taxi]KAJ5894768.1 hypothetical protein N7495_006459 [Penicillium taxi]
MDTAVSNPPLAMAQGERQTVHPFFQPGKALNSKSTMQETDDLFRSKESNAPVNVSEKPQKILKLNLNGRLLSSPPLDATPVSHLEKRKPGKQGRLKKVDSKLVVIKYSLDPGRNIGQLINNILCGDRTQLPPSLPVIPPPNIVKQQSKPTHPFFAKKSLNKPSLNDSVELLSQNQDKDSTASKNPTISAPERKRVPGTPAPFSSFSRPKKKFTELFHPIWPPRGFIHVTPDDSNIPRGQQLPVDRDHKKAKLRAVDVRDDESAFLTSTASAIKAAQLDLNLTGNPKPELRIPGKHIASGGVLGRAIDSQMSWSIPNRPSASYSSPLIKKFRSSLLSSVSAFDCGKYESQLWTQKYAPQTAEDVLQVGCELQLLRDWLCQLKVTAVDTGKSSKEDVNPKPKRGRKRKIAKKTDEFDDFIVSSGEEASEMDNFPGSDDELAGDVTVSSQKTVIRSGDMGLCMQHGIEKSLANAIIITGSPGCGKTASVYAVAKELDYEVFEINAGSRRSARDMLERVGDMTQNHLVHLLNEPDEPLPKPRESKSNPLMNFFKGQPSKITKTPEEPKKPSEPPEITTKKPREQKQSLILIEEADILFDEDKQFWTGVLALISQSRRPIVITCNDESLLPDMSVHAILRYKPPPLDLVVDYLLLIAAHEGHVLKRKAVSHLYISSGMNIRRSLMDLNFWCQIGVGSEKSGLDWILPQWPPGSTVDQNGDRVRVLSLNTYDEHMGWFNRDLFMGENALQKEIEALRNGFHWWRLKIQDFDDVAGGCDVERLSSEEFQSSSKQEQFNMLEREEDYLDMRSALDILSSGCSLDTAEVRIYPIDRLDLDLTLSQDIFDTSLPPMLESHRSNYIEAHPLLQADLLPEYSSLSEDISIAFDALLSQTFRAKTEDLESSFVTRIFNGWTKDSARRSIYPSNKAQFQKVFEPIMRAHYIMPLQTSFENGFGPITEDLAPYIRGIMVFDGRLKVYRDNLHAAWSQEQGTGHKDKRARTTRASRAALEGSDKAFTRRERWFPDGTNYFLVLGTGMPEWQQALFDMGHFTVQPAISTPVPDDNPSLILVA